MNQLTHASLFSGGGGFDLAAEWAGIPTRWMVERDPFCQRILRRHFPHATLYDDITTLDLSALEPVDIISGGFPCQPFSTAGQRRGAADDRFLWPAMREVIAAVRPTWVVGENVAGLITMGLDDVLDDLEAEGYTTWPCVIPAAAVGAPHRRDRVWIIAHTGSGNAKRRGEPGLVAGTPRTSESEGGQRQWGGDAPERGDWPAAHAEGAECQLTGAARSGRARLADGGETAAHTHGDEQQQRGGPIADLGRWFSDGDRADQWPEVAARFCRVDDGLPQGVDRGKRLRVLGNAIVPQVFYQIACGIKATYPA